MSFLSFDKSDVLENATRVREAILKSREKEAEEGWKEMHRPGFWSRWFGAKPCPPVDPEWKKHYVKNCGTSETQLRLAESMMAYCSRRSPRRVGLSLEDARRLWLVP